MLYLNLFFFFIKHILLIDRRTLPRLAIKEAFEKETIGTEVTAPG